jgi:hypothetical protein
VRKIIFKNLDAAYLKKSLLKNGLFSSKIVPLFNGITFCKFVLNTPSFITTNQKSYGLICHRIVDHKNSVRVFKIPHPYPYAILCHEISEAWDEIAKIIENNWENKKINALHVRKMATNPDCVFCMDYSSKSGEVSSVLLSNAVGKKYMVKADISNFFQSLYSHSIAWAAVGRKEAFNKRSHNTWYNRLDKAVMNSQEKESVGLPIGPHTSNVLSDLILSGVDKKLLDQGFDFIRYIDDYHCFTDGKDHADEFLVLLSDELAKIKLVLNRSKTKIKELPHTFDSTWTNKIKSFNFSKKNKSKLVFADSNCREILSFFDFVIELQKEEDDDSVLRYAIKMLRDSKFSAKAFGVYEQYVQHLIFLYPYLSDFIYDIYVSQKHYPQNTNFIDKMLSMGIERKLYATISRTIYAVLKFNLTSKKIENSVEEIIESRDCIAVMALLIYCKKNNIRLDPIVEFCKSIIKSGQTDEYWILVYELYRENKIHQDVLKGYQGYPFFKQLKDGKVTFINKIRL